MLAVSPQPAFRTAVTAALSDQHRIAVFETDDLGDEGLRVAQDLKPDTIVVDLNSAGMSGLRTIALLRDSLPDARIFCVSAYASKSLKVTARESGAEVLLVGTIHDVSVTNALRKAILRHCPA